jgi:hypothetical protein
MNRGGQTTEDRERLMPRAVPTMAGKQHRAMPAVRELNQRIDQCSGVRRVSCAAPESTVSRTALSIVRCAPA